MTDAVIHAHWHVNNEFSLSACGIRFERADPIRAESITANSELVTCPACIATLKAAGIAVPAPTGT